MTLTCWLTVSRLIISGLNTVKVKYCLWEWVWKTFAAFRSASLSFTSFPLSFGMTVFKVSRRFKSLLQPGPAGGTMTQTMTRLIQHLVPTTEIHFSKVNRVQRHCCWQHQQTERMICKLQCVCGCWAWRGLYSIFMKDLDYFDYFNSPFTKNL